MNRIAELDALVAQFSLNAHPFYQDWRMGTLPIDKLRDYAGEYGRFVCTIAEGWETIGNAHYAEEERVHERLWADFQLEIGAVAESNRSSTQTLVTAAMNAFTAKYATAIGALYAFEAQQPETSQSKLDGLSEHYGTSAKGKEYFKVHAGDMAEIELLRSMVLGLTDAGFIQAKHACATVCAAMLGALDGVYFAEAA
jgi:pyrroloquinoline-quinone synthase